MRLVANGMDTHTCRRVTTRKMARRAPPPCLPFPSRVLPHPIAFALERYIYIYIRVCRVIGAYWFLKSLISFLFFFFLTVS